MRSVWSRRAIVLVSIVSLATTGATAAADEVPSYDKALDKPITFAGVDVTAAGALVERFREVQADYPDAYGGTYFDEESASIVVRIKENAEGGDELTARLRAVQAGTGSVRFVSSRVSLRELEAATSKLSDVRAWAGDKAGKVAHVFLDEYRGAAAVDVLGDEDSLKKAASVAVDVPLKVTVVHRRVESQVGGSDGVAPLASTRRQDNPPYYGGLAIFDVRTTNPVGTPADCTTNFAYIKGSVRFAGTAAHCGPYNKHFWHGTRDIFRVSGIYSSSHGYDASLLAPTSAAVTLGNRIWWGSTNTGQSQPVTAVMRTVPVAGHAYWISGANGGMVAGRVLGRVQCNTGQLEWLVETNYGAPGSGPYTVGGDSGAPVVRSNTSTPGTDLMAVGVHNCGNEFNRSAFTWVSDVERVSASRVYTAAPTTGTETTGSG